MTLVHLLNYYYLLTLSRCNKKNPLESPGSGRIMTRIRTKVKWFVACDTFHPSIIYKNSSSLLNYKQHSSICQYPTMIKIPVSRRDPDRHQNLIGCCYSHKSHASRNVIDIRRQPLSYPADRQTHTKAQT